MKHGSLSERMSNANVRLEVAFWIGGLSASQPTEFKEFVEDDLFEQKDILSKFTWLAQFSDGGEAEDIIGEFSFRGVDGFIVQLATPVPTEFHDSGYSYSWGRYRTKWVYALTLDSICDQAEEWATLIVDQARAKASPQVPA